MFEALNARIEEETIRYLYLFEPVTASSEEQANREREREEAARRRQMREQEMVYSAGDAPPAPKKRDAAKVGRNDACPCGSGKKFKKCHGK